VRAELFRTIYFHRTVRAIDLTLTDLFIDSKPYLFSGNPLERLDQYQRLTEWSLLVDVARWQQETDDPRQRQLGKRWRGFLARQIPWKMVCQRNLVFTAGDAEQSSIFSEPGLVEQKIRGQLPPQVADIPLRIDIPRHMYRPHTHGPAAGQNFLYDSAHHSVRPLVDNQLFRQLPISHRICRIYAQSLEHSQPLARALDALLGPGGSDDLTNM
jgi:hypothetical protein